MPIIKVKRKGKEDREVTTKIERQKIRTKDQALENKARTDVIEELKRKKASS